MEESRTYESMIFMKNTFLLWETVNCLIAIYGIGKKTRSWQKMTGSEKRDRKERQLPALSKTGGILPSQKNTAVPKVPGKRQDFSAGKRIQSLSLTG